MVEKSYRFHLDPDKVRKVELLHQPPAPTDKRMWKRLLKRAHPDQGGEHDLFVWAQALHEHVAGDTIEPVVDDRPRRARHAPWTRPSSDERVPYEEASTTGEVVRVVW